MTITTAALAAVLVVTTPPPGSIRPANGPAPHLFQAAGPTAASIQSTVDQFRAALGAPNNGNAPGPLTAGRREINWDGGGAVTTALAPTPFAGFLNSRGSLFTTPGTGFVQVPVQEVAATFANPSYDGIFQAFSPVRLFAATGSTITDTEFFVPGGGNVPAVTRGFGAVFTDVDLPDGRASNGRRVARDGSTIVELFDAAGRLLFAGFVPAAPGDGGQSFLGVTFDDPVIARVRIVAGNSVPGVDDGGGHDVVLMDDFLYGEPQEHR